MLSCELKYPVVLTVLSEEHMSFVLYNVAFSR